MNERERLIESLDKVGRNILDFPTDDFISHLAEYLLADGWIRLPCKVGQTVYDLTFDEVNCYVVTEMNFSYTSDGLECEGVNAIGKYGLHFGFENIGKTVFLSRKDAEAKLKGGAE